MKMKNYILALICLFMNNYSFAADNPYPTLSEQTESWLKATSAETPAESDNSSGRIGDQEPTADPGVPVKDSLFVYLTLSGVYILILSWKRKLTARIYEIKR
jgi:hypothetical protein